MSSARNHAPRRSRLVLLRGGLDDQNSDVGGGDGGSDWQDFCRRIGWQPPQSEPSDDFEDRLAERLFAKPSPDNNVVRLDIERAVRAVGEDAGAAQADFAPISDVYLRPAFERLDAFERRGASERLDASEQLDASGRLDVSGRLDASGQLDASGRLDASERLDASGQLDVSWRLPISKRGRSGWGRAAFGASAALAVAAVLLVVFARLAGSDPGAPSASFPAVSAESAPFATTLPPVDRAVDRAPVDAPDPSDVAPPRRAPRHEAKTLKPAPKPRTSPTPKPEPPGTAIARTSPDSDAPARDPVALRAEDSTAPGADPSKKEASEADLEGAAIEARADVAELDSPEGIRADPAIPWGVVPRYRSGLPTEGTVSIAPVPLRPSHGVWTEGPPSAAGALDANGGRYASASWSLSPSTDRWLGASVTPSPLSGAAQANVGAMVQLDLGKALLKL